MKGYYLIILLLCFSCNKKGNHTIIDSNNKINIKKDSIKQFKEYQDLIINEKNKSPDSIISGYLKFSTTYPNSFWKQEIIKRISNIDSIRKYWSKKDGWKLLEIKPTKDIQNISCPSSFNF